VFHLAIPSENLDHSRVFYEQIGCKIGRVYDTHIVISFFDHQLVCHKSSETQHKPTMYPRHFGWIFESETDFFDYLQFVKVCVPEFIYEPYFCRHPGRFEEHHTFFLVDPSNNVIELKWYKYREAIV
jgi:extradiol dioxygenase family protein